MKCKNCVYWERRDYGKEGVVHECLVHDSTEYNGQVEDDGIAYYIHLADDTDLLFGIITGPEYGCLKFKSNK